MLRLSAVLVLMAATGWAQAHPSTGQFAAQQFGPAFSIAADVPPLKADLDGDGREDLVMVAVGRDPLPDQVEFHYRAVDPYHAYFGFGDPKITAQFATQEGPSRVLLVVHDWQAATPKAKFVVLNLPFERVSIGRMLRKKKVCSTIKAEEISGVTSSIYWTGKQYKWQPQ